MEKNRESPGSPILRIKELTVAYKLRDKVHNAVRDFSLEIEPGGKYGLVGESGSGKTTIALAILNYLGKDGLIQGGEVLFKGKDLLGLTKSQLKEVWGSQISLVPQNPQSSLNPSMRIGDQIAEVFSGRNGDFAGDILFRVLTLLERVHLPEPGKIARMYPHQISGGMQQRVLIAMALSLNPDLLLLDEPTTALDVTTEASILGLLQEEVTGSGSSALYVTHNLGVAAQFCDRLAVLYAGDLVEDGSLLDIFQRPLHPYTTGLIASIPSPGVSRRESKLISIPGQIPPLGARPAGCVFAPRCPIAVNICLQTPPLTETGANRSVRCHRWEEIEQGLLDRRRFFSTYNGDKPEKISKPVFDNARNLLDLKKVGVHFELPRSVIEVFTGKSPDTLKAVNGVTFSIPGGSTVGLVGESGSGKTTLARAIMGLELLTNGRVEFAGKALPQKLSERDFGILKKLQIVFQNPDEALNPHLKVGTSIQIPIQRLLLCDRDDAEKKAIQLMEAFQLPAEYFNKKPHQLSGGEKQRAALARSFASNPSLLIVDEPVSSLDVSVQAAVLNMLDEFQQKEANSLLFISHNLAVIGYMADIVAVIYRGCLMEVSRTEELFSPPYHPYTEALLSAIPIPDPAVTRARIHLEGDIPSPVDEPRGCPFHSRCPRVLGDTCKSEQPGWQFDRQGNRFYCHIPLEELESSQDLLFD